ncbi:MAG: hypothetical protein WDN03_16320 [Rhizomicrobium sp.]
MIDQRQIVMAMALLYRAYGLLVRSEVPVPGACPIAAADGDAADIEVAFGPARLTAPALESGPYRYDGNSVLFGLPDVGRYLCREGRHIVIEPAASATATDIGDFLIATAIPIILWMRPGEIVLHAAGVVLDGREGAIAICGSSGSGKSTILKALIAAGARVVGDDTLRVTFSPHAISVSGLPMRYCWNDRAGDARVGHDVAPERALSSAPLAALFVLESSRQAGSPRFRRLTGVPAFRALLAQRHRPKVPRLMAKEAELVSAFARLAKLPSYLWCREEGRPALSRAEFAILTGDRSHAEKTEEEFSA